MVFENEYEYSSKELLRDSILSMLFLEETSI